MSSSSASCVGERTLAVSSWSSGVVGGPGGYPKGRGRLIAAGCCEANPHRRRNEGGRYHAVVITQSLSRSRCLRAVGKTSPHATTSPSHRGSSAWVDLGVVGAGFAAGMVIAVLIRLPVRGLTGSVTGPLISQGVVRRLRPVVVVGRGNGAHRRSESASSGTGRRARRPSNPLTRHRGLHIVTRAEPPLGSHQIRDTPRQRCLPPDRPEKPIGRPARFSCRAGSRPLQ